MSAAAKPPPPDPDVEVAAMGGCLTLAGIAVTLLLALVWTLVQVLR